MNIYDTLKEACAKRGIQVQVGLLHEDGEVEAPAKGRDLHLKRSGCHGFCEMGPLLQIEPDGILYTHVQASDCEEIIDRTLLKGEVIDRLLYQLDGVTYAKHEEIPFYKSSTGLYWRTAAPPTRRTSTNTSPRTATPPLRRPCSR